MGAVSANHRGCREIPYNRFLFMEAVIRTENMLAGVFGLIE